MSENHQYHIPSQVASEETTFSSGDELSLRASTLDSPEIAKIRRDIFEVTQQGEMVRTPSERLGGLGEVLRIVRAKEAGMDLDESGDLSESVKFIHQVYADAKKDAA